MLKSRDDEIGFICLIVIVHYLIYGWHATLQAVLIVGGFVGLLFLASLIFDTIDRIKESRNKKRK